MNSDAFEPEVLSAGQHRLHQPPADTAVALTGDDVHAPQITVAFSTAQLAEYRANSSQVVAGWW